jgi:hypothetical protein
MHCVIMVILEQLAARLQELLQREVDLSEESDEDGDESIFNTITSSVGNNLTRALRDGIECELLLVLHAI